VYFGVFLNKFYPRRILVTLLGKGVWVGYCKILITHQNREISRNVGSTTRTLLNYMTVTAVLWAGRKLSALEMGADITQQHSMQECRGLRLATITERVKNCAIEDFRPLIFQY
jgi:Fe-S-cluster containining protein